MSAMTSTPGASSSASTLTKPGIGVVPEPRFRRKAVTTLRSPRGPAAPGHGMALRILHCVEFYHPSPGGAQAVVRQVSRELVGRGHEVTVATTRLPHRSETELDGARIEEFEVSGNAVHGLTGEVERYRSFVIEGGFDVVMTYAAQQWTTDTLLAVLGRIEGRKVLAPCGFSGLEDPAYAGYYSDLPARLAEFDELIFHSGTYQDIEFARRHGLDNLTVVPNGASRAEFEDL